MIWPQQRDGTGRIDGAFQQWDVEHKETKSAILGISDNGLGSLSFELVPREHCSKH